MTELAADAADMNFDLAEEFGEDLIALIEDWDSNAAESDMTPPDVMLALFKRDRIRCWRVRRDARKAGARARFDAGNARRHQRTRVRRDLVYFVGREGELKTVPGKNDLGCAILTWLDKQCREHHGKAADGVLNDFVKALGYSIAAMADACPNRETGSAGTRAMILRALQIEADLGAKSIAHARATLPKDNANARLH